MDDVLWVVDNTEPSATFLDGWTGAEVFRPQAWYYGFVLMRVLFLMLWMLMVGEGEFRFCLGVLRLGGVGESAKRVDYGCLVYCCFLMV